MPDETHAAGTGVNPGANQTEASGVDPKAAAKAAAEAAKAAAQPVTVVMSGGTRPWLIGESIGLSTGYEIRPGVPITMPRTDAELLLSHPWDGRAFEVVEGAA